MGDRTNITDAPSEPYSMILDELIVMQPDEGFSREQVASTIVAMLGDAGLLRADPDTSDELFTEARRLLDAATPGPWERPSPTANWFTVPQPIQIDEADWGQEAQENGAMCGYRIGTLADERAWRYADAELIAAAPRLIAALLERAVTAEADRDEAERRERTAVNLANYHRGVAREAGRRADAARPPAPTESTPDPPYQPVAGRPTMDLLDRGTDR